MSDALKPCPFCGGCDVLERDSGVVACDTCGASLWSEDVEDSDTVRDTWNSRAMPECVREVMRISDRDHVAWRAVREYYGEPPK
jgi:hypothetical protein